jgi:hypothetical protein
MPCTGCNGGNLQSGSSSFYLSRKEKKNSCRNRIDYEETFAAVARTKQMHRQLNSCCNLIILDLRVHLFDIKAASVYEKIDGETYMLSPKAWKAGMRVSASEVLIRLDS